MSDIEAQLKEEEIKIAEALSMVSALQEKNLRLFEKMAQTKSFTCDGDSIYLATFNDSTGKLSLRASPSSFVTLQFDKRSAYKLIGELHSYLGNVGK